MHGLAANRIDRREWAYLTASVVLVLTTVPLSWTAWHSTQELHTLLETVATQLSLLAGAMALVRYYSKKNLAILFLGTAQQ